jgi:hypothetical protein
VEAKKNEAATFKDKGNTFVKAKDYESALKMYSRAIELYDKDPVFFSNRSQCYLSLEKYQDCIDDATKAIELDPKSTKSFYRRMTAYEKLGEDYKALQSCRQWLDLAPEDVSANNTYDRIHNRIAEAEKKKDKEKIRWTRLRPNSELVEFVNRPPHLRSKRPLKTVAVELQKAASPIPESLIDRIFDNNTGEAPPETNSKLFKSNFLASPKVQPPAAEEKPEIQASIVDEKNKLNEQNETLKAETKKELPSLEEIEAEKSHFIAIPLSGPQFLSIWKELSDVQRFLYLRNIVESNVPVGKLLGAQLDSGILSDIIRILHKFFMPYRVPFVGVLSDLRDNSEIDLLKMFLEADEKESESSRQNLTNLFNFPFQFAELNELLSSASSCGDNATVNLVQEVKKFFQI